MTPLPPLANARDFRPVTLWSRDRVLPNSVYVKIWGIYVFGGAPEEGYHFLTMPNYLFFRVLVLKTISSLTSDLKKLI